MAHAPFFYRLLGLLMALIALQVPLSSARATSAQQPQQVGAAYLTNLSLEQLMEVEVVRTASRYEQKVADAPVAVTIVTAEDIRECGYRTLADVLQDTRGFYTTYDRLYDYVGMRGFGPPGDYNTRVLLLIDGHRINDNIYDQALIGTDLPLDLMLVDRIEIVRGPSSSLYGNNAFFGVINIITSDGSESDGLRAMGEVGSLNTYRVPVSLGGTTPRGFDYVLSASHYRSDGQSLIYLPELKDRGSDGISRDEDEDLATRGFARFAYKNLRVTGAWSDRDKGIATAAYDAALDDDRSRISDARGFLDVAYETDPTASTGFSGRVYYDGYVFKGDYVTPDGMAGSINSVMTYDRGDGRWWGLEAQLSRAWASRQRLIVGVDHQRDLKREQLYFDGLTTQENDRTGWRWGFYAQDEFTLNDRVALTAGVRHDEYDTFGGTTHPRVTLVLSPHSRGHLRLLYGTAFRAPNAYELYYYTDLMATAMSGLGPERIATYEATYEHALTGDLRALTSVFHDRIRDLITMCEGEDETVIFRNIEHVETTGAELELEGRFSSGIRFLLNYTYQDSKQGSGGTLANSPAHLAAARLRAHLVGRLVGVLRLQYVDSRWSLDGEEVDAYMLTHVTLSSRFLRDRLGLAVGIQNLFDSHYWHPVSDENAVDLIEQDGRTLRLTCDYRF